MTPAYPDARGLAWVPVSEDLLRALLHYPPDARIVGVEMAGPAIRGTDSIIRFLFASPDLPADGPIPEVTPTITAIHQTRQFDAPKRAEEWLWDWRVDS